MDQFQDHMFGKFLEKLLKKCQGKIKWVFVKEYLKESLKKFPKKSMERIDIEGILKGIFEEGFLLLKLF